MVQSVENYTGTLIDWGRQPRTGIMLAEFKILIADNLIFLIFSDFSV